MFKRIVRAIPASIFYLVSSSLPIRAWTGDYNSDGDPVATLQSLEGLFSNILSMALSAIGLATFVMILVGGFKYLTAGGDQKATEAAKGTITSGIIGLVLAISAWFILLAISKFTGSPEILKFSIPQ
jgi:hypothetical protein